MGQSKTTKELDNNKQSKKAKPTKRTNEDWDKLTTTEKIIGILMVLVVALIVVASIYWVITGAIGLLNTDSNEKNEQAASNTSEVDSEETYWQDDDEHVQQTEEEQYIDIQGQVAIHSSGLVIANKSRKIWENCRIEVNPGWIRSGYTAKLPVLKNNGSISAFSPNFIPWKSFSKGGARFNYATTKPESVSLTCHRGKVTGEMYFSN